MEPSIGQNNAYTQRFTDLYLPPEDYEAFNLALPDEKLRQMLVKSLEDNRAHWNQKPWSLEEIDKENVNYFLGEQLNETEYVKGDVRYKDNRLFPGIRAILAYATGQLTKPELTPSRSDNIYLKGARDLQMALYQHSLDEKADRKFRAATMNLVIRKRAYIKLRWDPNAGVDGDIVSEVCNPEDIIIDRNAKYLDNPNVIYHRIRCSIDELCARFPGKKADILAAFGIVQGRYSQMSKYVTYFEAWFTYIDGGKPREGVCWFLPEQEIILDKQPNPNWIYTGDDKKDRKKNLLACPPKPFVSFNYMNMGESYIDETSLFEQAKPQQEMINRRGRQIMENADYVNGRWVASKDAFNEEDAQKLINKGPKTVALASGEDISKSLINVGAQEMSQYAVNTLYDARSEVDDILGTPTQFRGAQPHTSDTATRDVMVKQQAGALQDDLVAAVSDAAENYYQIKLQMFRVYFDEDHQFACKGGDGKYVFITLNGESIDENVKIGVQADSMLPLDKAQIRMTAMDLWKAGQAIDYRTLMDDLGLPDPEVRTERYLKSHIDPINFLRSIEVTQIDTDAESDIQLVIMGKDPDERDNYSADYINYFNRVMASNRFQKLKPDVQQRLVQFFASIQHIATASANLQGSILDAAGIVDDRMPMPIPKTSVRIVGAVDPNQSAQLAGVQPDNPQAPPAPPGQPSPNTSAPQPPAAPPMP